MPTSPRCPLLAGLAPLLLACHPAPSSKLDCTASLADIPMLVDVSWTAPEGTERSWVDFTTADGAEHHVVAEDPSGDIALLLLGAAPGEDVSWTGSSRDANGDVATCAGTITVGEPTSDLPELTLAVDDAGWDPDVKYFFGAFYELLGTTSHVYVVDRSGRYLWYARSEPETVSVDVHVPRDGRGMLFNQFNRDLTVDDSSIRRLDWHGEEIERTVTPLAHHTFTERPDGTFAYNQLDPRDYTNPETGETDLWIGDSIAEVSPLGTATTVFSTWDWLEPAVNPYMSAISLYGGLDWTHGNLLRYDADRDNYLLSLAHVAQVLDIDASDMTVTRTFGGSGYHFEGDSTPFSYQHSPLFEDPATLMMFSTPTDGSGSGAFEYAIDNDAVSLTETWRYQAEDDSLCLGQAIPLPSSNVLVNFGCAARMQEVDREGNVVWEVDSTPGTGFGQVIPMATPPWESE